MANILSHSAHLLGSRAFTEELKTEQESELIKYKVNGTDKKNRVDSGLEPQVVSRRSNRLSHELAQVSTPHPAFTKTSYHNILNSSKGWFYRFDHQRILFKLLVAVDKFTLIAKPFASLKCDNTASLVPQLTPHSSAGTYMLLSDDPCWAFTTPFSSFSETQTVSDKA